MHHFINFRLVFSTPPHKPISFSQITPLTKDPLRDTSPRTPSSSNPRFKRDYFYHRPNPWYSSFPCWDWSIPCAHESYCPSRWYPDLHRDGSIGQTHPSAHDDGGGWRRQRRNRRAGHRRQWLGRKWYDLRRRRWCRRMCCSWCCRGRWRRCC